MKFARALEWAPLRNLWRGLTATLFVLIWAAPAVSNPADICNAAARNAARATGVPEAVLRAITLTETGRNKNGAFEPWPWTVNMEGKGVWLDTPADALRYAQENLQRGARSFDVGCFQLNYKWHGQAFASIEQMFDPTENALYAAKFLSALYAEKRDWVAAAGAYHSRTPKFADRYETRFARILARLDGAPPASMRSPEPQTLQVAQAVIAPPPENPFPLLIGQAAAQSNLGSLFPKSAGAGALRLIGGG